MKSPNASAYLALLAVYFFWGTTYLGIRVALEGLPPLVLVSIRFICSGLILLVAAKFLKAHIPRGRELWSTVPNGIGTLGLANTCLTISEQWIPAGLAALFVTTSPFWMIGVDAAVPGGDKVHPRVLWGMLLGLAGVLLLLIPTSSGGGVSTTKQALLGFAVIQLGNLGWSAGSILQRRLPSRAHPVVAGAVQQLATGLLLAAPAYVLQADRVNWTNRSWLALVWLITFGSIVGYSAYLYALDKLPVTLVSTYTYVNPVVACVLGWWILQEPLGWREIGAMGVIFLGVWAVKQLNRPRLSPTVKAAVEPEAA